MPVVALLVVVAVADLLILLDPPLLLLAVLDEPAHLATTALVLLAVGAPRGWPVVLAASVLVDADHVPLYLGVPGVEAAGGRPLTHSLATLGALLLLSLRWPLLRLVALGVALHLVRDAFTGPGLPLLWPADVVVLLPYPLYAAGLVVVALLASRRTRRAALASAAVDEGWQQ